MIIRKQTFIERMGIIKQLNISFKLYKIIKFSPKTLRRIIETKLK